MKIEMDERKLTCAKDLFFVRNFRPSATPRFTFASPGLSNVNLFKVYVPDFAKKKEVIVQHKKTDPSTIEHPKTTGEVSEKTNQANLQLGNGSDVNQHAIDDLLKHPIKVKRTLLDSIDSEGTVTPTSGEPDQKKAKLNKNAATKKTFRVI